MTDKPNLYTVSQVAAMTGRTDIAIRKLAQRKGIGEKFGNAWMFTDDDVAAIKAIDPRGGVPRLDGSAPEHTAGFDRIKNRGPKKKAPSPPDDGSL